MQIVVQPELTFAGVGGGQFICRDGAGEELLQPSGDLGAAHRFLPEMELAQAIGAVDPIPAALVGPGVFRVHVEGKTCGEPGEVKSEGIGALVLQQLLPGGADLDAGAGQEQTHASANIAIGLQIVVCGAYGRNINRVCKVDVGVGGKSAAQHQAVARSGGDGENQGILLQATNPDGIQALVEDSEGCEKTSHSDGEVRIGDVVGLQVVEVLTDRAGVRAAAFRALKGAFKFGA